MSTQNPTTITVKRVKNFKLFENSRWQTDLHRNVTDADAIQSVAKLRCVA